MRIAYLAATALGASLMVATGSWAAGGGGGGGPTMGIAPLGAPPSNDATRAYAFRANMSQEPACQRLSQEADNVFMNAQMEMDAKVKELNRIEGLARQSNCLQKYPMSRGGG